eukprot:3485807-Rhodomonas_salina.1
MSGADTVIRLSGIQRLALGEHPNLHATASRYGTELACDGIRERATDPSKVHEDLDFLKLKRKSRQHSPYQLLCYTTALSGIEIGCGAIRRGGRRRSSSIPPIHHAMSDAYIGSAAPRKFHESLRNIEGLRYHRQGPIAALAVVSVATPTDPIRCPVLRYGVPVPGADWSGGERGQSQCCPGFSHADLEMPSFGFAY